MAEYSFYPKRKRSLFGMFSVTTRLIIANIAFYLTSLFIIFAYGEEFFLRNVALTPSLILAGKSMWTFLTSMFSHVSFFHIFVNMFSLFFVGSFLEKLIGGKRFFLVYLIAGLVGGVFFVFSGMAFGNDTPGIGASGALFGILGVLAVLVPYSKIYLIVGPLILILLQVILTPVIPAGFSSVFTMIVNILMIFMIFGIFSFNSNVRKFAVPIELSMWLLPIVAIVPLLIIEIFVDLPIGNSAHIGGLFLGLLYGFYLRRKYPKKTVYISRYFR